MIVRWDGVWKRSYFVSMTAEGGALMNELAGAPGGKQPWCLLRGRVIGAKL